MPSGQIRDTQLKPGAVDKTKLADALAAELDAKALDSAVVKKDGTSTMTAPLKGVAGVLANEYIVKSQLDAVAGGTQIRAQVLSSLAAQPAHVEGNRYRATATAGDWTATHLYTSVGGVWVSDGAPASGWLVYDVAANDWLYFNGLAWEPNFQGFQVVFPGSGLSQDAGKNFNVNVDNATIEVQANTLQVIPNTFDPYATVAEALVTPHTANQTFVLVNPVIAAPFVVNLPAGATHATGKVYIKDKKGMTSNPATRITIVPNGLETIDGEASLVLNNNKASVTLVFTGTEWSIV